MRKVVGCQGGFVKLNPRGTRCAQGGQCLRVCGHGLVDAGERIEVGGSWVGLSQGQVGDGTNQDGAGHVAPLTGVREAAHDRVIREAQRRVGSYLGDQIVVVRVEPLRHFFGTDLVVAASESKVEVKALTSSETRGDGTQENRGIQDVVIQGGRIGKRSIGCVKTKGDQARQVFLAQLVCRVKQFGVGYTTRPAGLEGTLELTFAAYTRIGQDRGGGKLRGGSGHGVLLGCATRAAHAGLARTRPRGG